MNPTLSQEQIDFFNLEGYLVIKSFYDMNRDIEPIHFAIYNIIGLLIKKYNLPFIQAPFSSETFDSCFQDLITHDRKLGSEAYDAVKQIPAFVRLVSSERHDSVFSQIRKNSFPGVAAGGYGIRMDHPGEEKFRAGWHQDYTSQFRSIDGLVFWSPLVQITESIGPLQICPGSHKEGMVPVHTQNGKEPGKTGAYATVLKDEENLLSKYPVVHVLASPGDLLILDFLVIHASGYNVSNRSRWSMQMRHFNFNDPTGIKIGWAGSFAAGKSIESVHPELIADRKGV
ncbi:phytanoyl-CoA dioxygenase family protein [Cohnella suwonensis]|uniref:Phytanoyl-CoA dioxygenase family protein n=1 Tax=Cohnella suwonensis TaxID=696072 RepID=A0ABW0LV52_9BACL